MPPSPGATTSTVSWATARPRRASSPVQVRGVGGTGYLSGIAAIEAGDNHDLAVKTGRDRAHLGEELLRPIGGWAATPRSTPVQVKGEGGVGNLSGVSMVAAGEGHSLALKTDGTVWGWGNNGYGELGDGTTTDRAYPVGVKGVGGVGYLSGITDIVSGEDHAVALKSDGSVFAWGYNTRRAAGRRFHHQPEHPRPGEGPRRGRLPRGGSGRLRRQAPHPGLVERLHVNQIREIIYRLRQGYSERQVAEELGMSRVTVHKYHMPAFVRGYLTSECELPSDRELVEKLGPKMAPPWMESTVAPYGEVVDKLLTEGVEMVAILARLREDHGYRGSYSSLRRYVAKLRPRKVEPCVRVHTRPGEEAQVDFGSVGQLFDPRDGLARTPTSSWRPSATAVTSMPSWSSTRRSPPGSPVIATPSRASGACPGASCPTT